MGRSVAKFDGVLVSLEGTPKMALELVCIAKVVVEPALARVLDQGVAKMLPRFVQEIRLDVFEGDAENLPDTRFEPVRD